jgi:predicted metal-dependent hydrolase
MAMAGTIPTQSTPPRVQSRPVPAGVEIKVRRPKFAYPEDKKDWAGDNPVFSRFMESLSMLFPEGERFFVEAVNHYKEQIVDPVLRKQVAAFAAQEGMHSVEHHKYNVRAAGDLAEELEGLAGHLRQPAARRALSHMNRLAVTVALEHFTAIMADELLRNPAYSDLMDPEHAKLWLWHAVEETEHKAVAFDVYEAVGGGYVRRAIVMQIATVLFFLGSAELLVRLLGKTHTTPRPGEVTRFLNLAFGSPGFFRKVFPAWLDFFRPAFHPWQRDNSDLIAKWKARYAEAA